MTKPELLKPFATRIHVYIVVAYTVVIGNINFYRYGKEQLVVFVPALALMLLICYLHRYWFRRILFRGLDFHRTLYGIAVFVSLLVGIYLWLYRYPDSISLRLLRDPENHSFIAYLIDFFTFYWSFLWKGIVLVLAEVMYNVLRLLLETGRMKRGYAASAIANKHMLAKNESEQVFRSWIGHYLGNMGQSINHLMTKTLHPKSLLQNANALWAYGAGLLGLEGNKLIPLSEELEHLQQLASLYPDQFVAITWSKEVIDHPIYPLMLLELYKNMIKHTDFDPEVRPATFNIVIERKRLVIHTNNAIAEESRWMYGRGLTGLENLERMLRVYFVDAFSMHYGVVDGRFDLRITILYTKHYNT